MSRFPETRARSNPLRRNIRSAAAVCLPVAIFCLQGCATAPVTPGVSNAANQAAAAKPASSQLAVVLGSLAQGSRDKCQLSLLAGFKGLSPAAARFNRYMQQSQRRLLNQLAAWGRRHHLQLKDHHRSGLFRTADHLESSADAHALLSSSGLKFEHLYLLLMYTDYSWQIQLDKAALEYKIPPVPVAYLQNALKVNRHSKRLIERLIFPPAGHS